MFSKAFGPLAYFESRYHGCIDNFKGKEKLVREHSVKAVAVTKAGSHPRLTEFQADLSGY